MANIHRQNQIGIFVSIILLIFALYIFTPIIQIPQAALITYTHFISRGASHANLRIEDPTMINAWYARQIIPAGARVGFSPSDWGFQRVKVFY